MSTGIGQFGGSPDPVVGVERAAAVKRDRRKAEEQGAAREAERPEQDDAERIALESKQKFLETLADRGLRPNARLSIAKDDASGSVVYTILDQATGEVYRQWPSEDFLSMLRHFRETEGLLVDERA